LRPAVPGDAGAIAALCGQLGYPTDTSVIRSRLGQPREVSERAVTVAWAGDRVVGWVEVQAAGSLESGSWAEITGLIVDENARCRGAGARLVQWSKEWALAHYHTRLRVRTNVVRREAATFYERQGFTQIKEQRIFDLPI
jgi:GNAT superfamily N-acetyltransferase